jgi:hypothetical protein
MQIVSMSVATEKSSDGNVLETITESFRAVMYELASMNFLVSVLSTDYNQVAWPPVIKKLSLYRSVPDASFVLHVRIIPDSKISRFEVLFHAGDDGTDEQIRPVFNQFVSSLKNHHPWIVENLFE